MDWFDILAVPGTLKSLLQHDSLKASILQLSAFFMVQLSRPYTTTGKTIGLTIWTFVSKVMSRFLIHYLGLPYLFFQGASIFLESKKKNLFLLFPYLFAMNDGTR